MKNVKCGAVKNERLFNENDTEEMCPICFSDFVIGENVKIINCKHLFHSDCLIEWLKYKKQCPTCKTKVK